MADPADQAAPVPAGKSEVELKKDRKKSTVSIYDKIGAEMSTQFEGRRSTRLSRASLSRLRLRKASYGFGSVPGVRPVERTSQVAIEFKRPPLLFLNTFQLDSHKQFDKVRVEREIEEILDELWNGHKYNPTESPALAMRLAGECMRRVKAMEFNRYRVISIVTLGQNRAQSFNNTVSVLWDCDRDAFVEAHRKLVTAFVQVTVFGIYLD